MTIAAGVLLDRAGEELPLAELSALWPLGGWASISLVPGGKNEHFRVASADGIHYLRRSYRSKPLDELAAQLALMRLLRARGVPAPEVVPARTGADHVELFGRWWIATRGVAGEPFDDGSLAHVRALGDTLGRYHRVVADQPAPVAEPALLRELRGRAAEPGVDPALRTRAEDVAGRLPVCCRSCPGPVHGGARRGSLVFDGRQVVGGPGLRQRPPGRAGAGSRRRRARRRQGLHRLRGRRQQGGARSRPRH